MDFVQSSFKCLLVTWGRKAFSEGGEGKHRISEGTSNVAAGKPSSSEWAVLASFAFDAAAASNGDT